MTYTIELLRSAQKQLFRLDRDNRVRIIEAIRQLAEQPRPPGSKKLSARPAWRIRIGRYRVIYEIQDECFLVLVIDIGHRKEIYRN